MVWYLTLSVKTNFSLFIHEGRLELGGLRESRLEMVDIARYPALNTKQSEFRESV